MSRGLMSFWLVTADARAAQVFECRWDSEARLVATPLSSIRSTHEGEHVHQRPPLSGGAERRGAIARSGGHAAPHSFGTGHADEEEVERFAREVGTWLGALSIGHGVDHTIVFAPPRFLGLLREHVPARGGLLLLEGDLSHHRASELAAHPAVVAAASKIGSHSP